MYVDDLILTGSSEVLMRQEKDSLNHEFEMKDLGLLHYCLGIETWRHREYTFLTQSKYIHTLLDTYNMLECKALDTPAEASLKLNYALDEKQVDATHYRSLVGSLIYATITRPDISYAVGLVSQFMQDPRESHWKAAKRILRYLKGTVNYGLKYNSGGDLVLQGWCDADWASDIDSRRSISGYVFSLGSGAVSWSCKKQPTVALSSTEAEYRAAQLATREAVWLRRFLEEIDERQSSATIIHCDNQSCIKIAKNPVFHARTKHIEIHYHFVREKVLAGEVELRFCPTEDQVADIFTKGLSREKFQKFRTMLGVEANHI